MTDDDLRMLMHLSDARQCQPKFLILEVHENLSRIDSLAQSKLMEEFLYRLSYLKCHCLITDAAPGRLRITHLGKNLLRVFSENDDLPNPRKKLKPKAFIGSSVEGLPHAQKLRALLEYDIRASIWNEGTVFGLGDSTMESLDNAVQEFAFAIFLFTPDDQLITRRRKRPVARDNVLFELGLFTGKLGRHRSFIVHPSKSSIALPSDLSGITTATYNPDEEELAISLGPVAQQIRENLQRVMCETDADATKMESKRSTAAAKKKKPKKRKNKK